MKKFLESVKFAVQCIVALAAVGVIVLFAGVLAKVLWAVFKFGWSWFSF